MSLAERRAAEIMAAVNNQITPEQTRHVWLSVSSLTASARDAEHAAYLLMAESNGNGNPVTIADFNKFMRDHLNKVREQMAFIRSVLEPKQ